MTLPRPLLYTALAVVAAGLLVWAVTTCGTSHDTLPRKQVRQLEQHEAGQQHTADSARTAGQAHEDSAHRLHESPIIRLAPADTARIRRVWSGVFGH